MSARRLAASLLASLALHAAGLAVVLHSSHPDGRPAATVIPVSLVAGLGGGEPGVPAGPPAAAEAPPASPAPPGVPPATSRPAAPRRAAKTPPARVAAVRPAPAAPAPVERRAAGPEAGSDVAAVTGGPGGRAGGGGGGGGDGSGGDGGGARATYGTNPLPPYPLVARRLGMEGVVVLEVVVAPDGRAADVRLVESSGFAPLDDSATRTVRDRWRFVPAQRGGAPVESRVRVPIRFRLADGRS